MTNGSAISLRYDKIGFTIGRSPIERKGDLIGHEPVLQRWREQVRGNRTGGVRRRDWRRWPQDRRLPFPAAAQAVTASFVVQPPAALVKRPSQGREIAAIVDLQDRKSTRLNSSH